MSNLSNILYNVSREAFYNFTKPLCYGEINLDELCPSEFSIYMDFYKAYIIFFGICLFGFVFMYIIMDIRYQRLKEENKKLLKGYIKEE